jgi:hypothetical protein
LESKNKILINKDLFLSKRYFGEINDLLEIIRGWGVQEIHFININKIVNIPRLLRSKMMLGRIGIIYGKK